MQAESEPVAPLGLARPAVRRRWQLGRREADTVSQIAILLVLALGAVAMIVPFEWSLATSLSREANIAMPRIPQFWPPDASFFNYRIALTNLPILTYYLNSLIVTVGATLGYLLFSAMAGYAFAKGRFPGKALLFVILLTTLMIPFEMRMVPMYLEMRDLHLNDNLLALILPFVAGGFGTFLMRQYMTSIPDDLIDAARIDGASEFIIYWTVVLPLCGPVLAALTVLSALWRWNDVLWPLLVISNNRLYTVTLGLAVSNHAPGTLTGIILANTALAILPIVALYIFLQRFIVRGIMMSGLKG